MSKRILTKAKFKKWLESKHSRTKVGCPQSCSSCPLAKFLTQTTGTEYSVGSLDYYEVWKTTKYALLPEWARMFIADVDNTPYQYVTATTALRLLAA